MFFHIVTAGGIYDEKTLRRLYWKNKMVLCWFILWIMASVSDLFVLKIFIIPEHNDFCNRIFCICVGKYETQDTGDLGDDQCNTAQFSAGMCFLYIIPTVDRWNTLFRNQ